MKGQGNQRSGRNRKVFSLIELLVVFSVFLVMISAFLPAFRSVMDKTRSARCVNHLRQLGLVYHEYAEDHYASTPRTTAYPYFRHNLYSTGYLTAHLEEYHEDEKSPHENGILGCPAEQDDSWTDSANGRRYRGSHYGVEFRIKNLERVHLWDPTNLNKGEVQPERTVLLIDAMASSSPNIVRMNNVDWRFFLNFGQLNGKVDIFRHRDGMARAWYVAGHVGLVNNWVKHAMSP